MLTKYSLFLKHKKKKKYTTPTDIYVQIFWNYTKNSNQTEDNTILTMSF